MHVAAVVHSRLEATSPWGLAREAKEAEAASAHCVGKKFSPRQFAHFGMVSRGNCWLSVQGNPSAIPLTGGDCFLVAPEISYALRDNPGTPEFLRSRASGRQKHHFVRRRRSADNAHFGISELRNAEFEARDSLIAELHFD
jgi:cupin